MFWLPELDSPTADLTCQKVLTVQNVGHDPSKAVLFVWGEQGACPPQAAGPLKVECSGLILPGRIWSFSDAQIATGARSGLVLSFIARPISELGIDMGFDDIAADLMCETLFFGTVGDADDTRRFLEAYRSGQDFAGMPQERRWGAPIAVDLLRRCDPDGSAERAAGYGGITPWSIERFSRDAGEYRYFAPFAPRSPGAGVAILSIQNAGLECAIAELVVRAHSAPDDAEHCRFSVGSLAPGERQRVDLSACGDGAGGEAAAWIRASQPMAIVVDLLDDQAMSSYAALPMPPSAAADAQVGGATPGTRFLAPLAYHEQAGWSSRVHVQNTNDNLAARVRVAARDRSAVISATRWQHPVYLPWLSSGDPP